MPRGAPHLYVHGASPHTLPEASSVVGSPPAVTDAVRGVATAESGAGMIAHAAYVDEGTSINSTLNWSVNERDLRVLPDVYHRNSGPWNSATGEYVLDMLFAKK